MWLPSASVNRGWRGSLARDRLSGERASEAGARAAKPRRSVAVRKGLLKRQQARASKGPIDGRRLEPGKPRGMVASEAEGALTDPLGQSSDCSGGEVTRGASVLSRLAVCSGRQSPHMVLPHRRSFARGEMATTGVRDTITSPSEVGDAGNGHPTPVWTARDRSRASARSSAPGTEAPVGKREPIAQKLSSPEVNARCKVGCRSW